MLHCAEIGVVDSSWGPLDRSDLAYHLLEDSNDPNNEVSGMISCMLCAQVELSFVIVKDSCDFCPEVPDLRGCLVMHEFVVHAEVARRLAIGCEAFAPVVCGAPSAQIISRSAFLPRIGMRIVVCVAGVNWRVLAVTALSHLW